jgi:hypothetical protein
MSRAIIPGPPINTEFHQPDPKQPRMPVKPTFGWQSWFQQVSQYINGAMFQQSVSITANYSASPGDVIRANTAAGAIVVTLPPAKSSQASPVRIIKVSADGNAVTVAASGTDTLSGFVPLTAQYQHVTAETDSVSDWAAFS